MSTNLREYLLFVSVDLSLTHGIPGCEFLVIQSHFDHCPFNLSR